jgi:hypothetical protein
MLVTYAVNHWFYCIILPLFIFLVSAGRAYRVNARLTDDNPKKRNYSILSIFLAPFTWPIFLLVYFFILIVKVLAYGLFLILFAIALVVIRKPFLFEWLDRIFTSIGNKLLWANTLLIKIVFGR